MSIVLLQTIDQRLCSLVSELNKSYLGTSFDDLSDKYPSMFTVGGATFNLVFGKSSGYLFFDETECVLAVERDSDEYTIFLCISPLKDVESFVDTCEGSGINNVAVSTERVMTIHGKSINFKKNHYALTQKQP